jgi:hypothetical protein
MISNKIRAKSMYTFVLADLHCYQWRFHWRNFKYFFTFTQFCCNCYFCLHHYVHYVWMNHPNPLTYPK